MDSNRITILGRQYTVKGNYAPVYLEELAEYVDTQMRQIMQRTGTVDTLKVAILVALNTADCYFRARKELQLLEDGLETDIKALSEQIELALSP